MTFPRRLVLIFVLCFAQLAAGAHAVEHAMTKEGPVPSHVCELCLAAHDLGAGLPVLAAMPPPDIPVRVFEAALFAGRSHLPALPARQGAPPAA